MVTVKVALVLQGSLGQPIDLDAIRKWHSKLFKIESTEQVGSLPNSMSVPSGYTDGELARVFSPSQGADVTLAIVGAQLELNFYARVIPSGVAVLSLYEMNEILDREHYSVETFILRCIYALVLTYIECGRTLDMAKALRLHHDEPRGCLYDFNQDKTQIVRSLHLPKLCAHCVARLGNSQIDRSFVPTLERELKRIRRARYYRIVDWARRHPISALLLTTAWALLLNIVASIAYDGIKTWLRPKPQPNQSIAFPGQSPSAGEPVKR